MKGILSETIDPYLAGLFVFLYVLWTFDKVRNWVKNNWSNWLNELVKVDFKKNARSIGLFILLDFFIIFLAFSLWSLVKIALPSNIDKGTLGVITIMFINISIITLTLLQVFNTPKNGINRYYLSFLLFLFIITPQGLLVFNKWPIYVILTFTILWDIPSILNNWKDPPLRIMSLIITALLFSIIGFIFITTLYGDQPIKLNFYPCGKGDSYASSSMECSNPDGRLIVGYETSCKLESPLNNTLTEIYFNHVNGSLIKKETINGSIKFIPPAELLSIRFLINGTIADGSKDCIDNTWPVRFPTWKEHQEHRDKFFAYLAALIGVILFSLPSLFKGKNS